MSADVEVWDVPDSNGVFLGISAANYAAADDALWKLKTELDRRNLNPTDAQHRHLTVIRARRKAAYSDLVAWVMACDTERTAMVTGAGDVTPVTSPRPHGDWCECAACTSWSGGNR